MQTVVTLTREGGKSKSQTTRKGMKNSSSENRMRISREPVRDAEARRRVCSVPQA
jgi:hypothetical protein